MTVEILTFFILYNKNVKNAFLFPCCKPFVSFRFIDYTHIVSKL